MPKTATTTTTTTTTTTATTTTTTASSGINRQRKRKQRLKSEKSRFFSLHIKRRIINFTSGWAKGSNLMITPLYSPFVSRTLAPIFCTFCPIQPIQTFIFHSLHWSVSLMIITAVDLLWRSWRECLFARWTIERTNGQTFIASTRLFQLLFIASSQQPFVPCCTSHWFASSLFFTSIQSPIDKDHHQIKLWDVRTRRFIKFESGWGEMDINNDFELQMNNKQTFLFCGNFQKQIECFDMLSGKSIAKSSSLPFASSLHSFCYNDRFRVIESIDQFDEFYGGTEGFWIPTPQPTNPLHLSFYPLFDLFTEPPSTNK